MVRVLLLAGVVAFGLSITDRAQGQTGTVAETDSEVAPPAPEALPTAPEVTDMDASVEGVVAPVVTNTVPVLPTDSVIVPIPVPVPVPMETKARRGPGGRLALGTRFLHYSLHETYRATYNSDGSFDEGFLGTIEGLEEEQDYAPTRLYAQYAFTDYVGIGVSYDKLRVRTITHFYEWEDESTRPLHTDGDFEFQGPIFYALLAYPNESRFTPFGEIGLAYYMAEFQPTEDWGDGGRRELRTEDAMGFAIAGGCDIALTDNWAVNGYVRYVDVELDVDYYLNKRYRTSAVFPMSYTAMGLGVSYTF